MAEGNNVEANILICESYNVTYTYVVQCTRIPTTLSRSETWDEIDKRIE